MNKSLLRGKRAEHGLSQEEIAKSLNITRTTYRLKEAGQREFTNIEMRNLARVLKLDLSDINAIFFNNQIT